MAGCVGGHPDDMVIGFQHGASGVLFAIDGGIVQGAVLIHGDTAMIEQIAIIDLINGAVIQKKFKMTLHPDTITEGEGQIVHDSFLLRRETIGVFR